MNSRLPVASRSDQYSSYLLRSAFYRLKNRTAHQKTETLPTSKTSALPKNQLTSSLSSGPSLSFPFPSKSVLIPRIAGKPYQLCPRREFASLITWCALCVAGACLGTQHDARCQRQWRANSRGMSGELRVPELRLGPPGGGSHLLVPPSPSQPRRRHSWICG